MHLMDKSEGKMESVKNTDDNSIVEMYWQRDENAIGATKEKYGKYCYSIAYRILRNCEDAEESENDTYVGAWNSMPPHKPEMLSTYLGKLTRNISLKRWRSKTADKRGGGEAALTLDELEECIPSNDTVESEIEVKELGRIIDSFLRGISHNERTVFIRRYWYFDSIKDVSVQLGYSEGKVKMMLSRTRGKLKEKLKEEGVTI